MALVGEIYVADVLGKAVLDPTGEEIGRVNDLVVEAGSPYPRAAALLVEKGKRILYLPWAELNLFNRKVITSRRTEEELSEAPEAPERLLLKKDLLDKQIVDINGAKIVRVNDVRLTGEGGVAYLTDVDVGAKGILRRLGVERRGDAFFRAIRHPLESRLISWEFLQPLQSKLHPLTLSVSRDAVADLHPADLAQILSRMAPEERQDFFEKLDTETAAETLHELEPEVQADLIVEMDKEQAADILEQMPPDEAADLIGDLPAEKAQEILGLMEKDEAADVSELLSHEDNTAGGMMTNEYLAFPPDITLSEALERFRVEAQEVEAVNYVYVTEGEKLVGVVALRDLLLHDPEKTLSEVMHRKLITVAADADEWAVAEAISKYNLLALPVVDEEMGLMGVVTVDDVVDFLLPPASRKKRRKM
jgi:CBS domain-containing protein